MSSDNIIAMSDLFNLNEKQFRLVDNSANGQVTEETRFNFKQEGNCVTAEYYGGGIIRGHILATKNVDQLDMRYHCITDENEFKCGMAIAKISVTSNNKIILDLDWVWIHDPSQKGKSRYIEI